MSYELHEDNWNNEWTGYSYELSGPDSEGEVCVGSEREHMFFSKKDVEKMLDRFWRQEGKKKLLIIDKHLSRPIYYRVDITLEKLEGIAARVIAFLVEKTGTHPDSIIQGDNAQLYGPEFLAELAEYIRFNVSDEFGDDK